MASIIGVETLQHTNGTTAATIDSSGRVLKSVVPYALVDWAGSAYVSHSVGDFDHAEVNDGNHYSTSNYKFTCPVDGLYLCCISLLRYDDSGAAVEANLDVNGFRVFRAYQKERALQASYVHKATAGDEIKWGSITNATYYEGTDTSRYSFASFTFLG